MGVRRQAREAALQALFMLDFRSDWEIDPVVLCFDHFSVSQAAKPYAQSLVEGVKQNLSKIDSQITRASEHWSINRMSRVDRSILRLATFEISFLDEIPANVAINEAIEVAKRFGADESPLFVNGVLDKVASSLRRSIEVEKTSKKKSASKVSDEEVSPTAASDDDELLAS